MTEPTTPARCWHQVTLDTDYARMLEVVRCVRCGLRAEIPFNDLDGGPDEDAVEVVARYVRAVFGVPVKWHDVEYL